jgi:hypothetical protein
MSNELLDLSFKSFITALITDRSSKYVHQSSSSDNVNAIIGQNSNFGWWLIILDSKLIPESQWLRRGCKRFRNEANILSGTVQRNPAGLFEIFCASLCRKVLNSRCNSASVRASEEERVSSGIIVL